MRIAALCGVSAALPRRARAWSSDWQDAWAEWSSVFCTQEGRVVDGLQGDASHSEGQGWGLLLAAAFRDRPAFARIFAWTEDHLAVRRDPLLAWRWRPDRGVSDYNNATDGDLFYAWALLRGARIWGEERYADRAGEIVRAIDDILIRPSPEGDGMILRPAAENFSDDGTETINPSYYMPRAMHDLAAAFQVPRLARASDDGEALLARLARSGPVPDWVTIAPDGPRAAPNLSGGYSYDALRVPLYLVWSARSDHPAVAAVRALPTHDGVPVSMELAGGRILDRSSMPGYVALYHLLGCTGAVRTDTAFPPFTARQPYYPATLHLLTTLAAAETDEVCLL